MKVFDLVCELGHVFEGWFASAAAFDDQLTRSFVRCPVCDSTSIRRTPSAPRLNLSASNRPEAVGTDSTSIPAASADAGAGAPAPAAASMTRLRALWFEAARHLVRNTENVGDRFAEEARRIHYREAPERGIRGVTTVEQRAELEEEGISTFSFPMPPSAEEPLQ